ncbi:MAG: glycosyltransferase family 2 protein [Promethearchaeota archaeon]|jgi:rhamnopyranosyl-N-acetylglucosaminyl-diphospho-decaprenol beta-1,3/1,4-galactofuranosyltransferase
MKERDKETICGVIVTFNKKELLGECLDALLRQTRALDAIIVIDNASSDGTETYMKNTSSKDSRFEYIRLPVNRGGAGGFYEGLKRGYERGFDWLWTMDDDGRPEPETLERLIKRTEPGTGVLHPLVISPDDANVLSFGCWFTSEKGLTLFKTVEELKKVFQDRVLLPSLGNPFIGTLLTRKVIQEHGLPRPELFIWGDELEYMFRLQKAGVTTKVVCDAKFSHPSNPHAGNHLALLEMDIENWWKLYYYLRNHIVTVRLYRKPVIAELVFIAGRLRDMLYILFSPTRHKFEKIRIIIIATYHALIGRFGQYSIQK